MKVLWFTNTPSKGADYLGSKQIGGGWIESLESHLTSGKQVQLGVAFKTLDQKARPFKVNETFYFPVYRQTQQGSFLKFINRWKHNIEKDDNINLYLDIIKDFKPDLIQIFGTESEFGMIIPQTNVPCIIYIQGILSVINHKWFSGLSLLDVFRYSQKLRLLKGYGVLHDYYRNIKSVKREKMIYRKCQYFIGRTDWDKRVSAILASDSTYYHCDEIMRPGFYQSTWQQEVSGKDRFIILSTMRDGIYKGLETIYECNEILRENVPDIKPVWKIAGISMDSNIYNILIKKYTRRFDNSDIIFLGSLSESDLICEMKMANLFIHPSHIDNSPNSVCEAMMLGMPVISTYSGGIPSIIEDKNEGLLIQDGDPYALAGAIVELYRDRDYAFNLGLNARKRALTRHNPEKIVSNLLNIYNSVLSATRAL